MGEFTDVVVLDFYILTVISGRTAMRATCRLTHLHNFRIAKTVLPRRFCRACDCPQHYLCVKARSRTKYGALRLCTTCALFGRVCVILIAYG
jgi:hypothetical protein